MLMRMIACKGGTNTVRVCTKNWLGEESLAPPGNQTHVSVFASGFSFQHSASWAIMCLWLTCDCCGELHVEGMQSDESQMWRWSLLCNTWVVYLTLQVGKWWSWDTDRAPTILDLVDRQVMTMRHRQNTDCTWFSTQRSDDHETQTEHRLYLI